jgi:hypothetical protein
MSLSPPSPLLRHRSSSTILPVPPLLPLTLNHHHPMSPRLSIFLSPSPPDTPSHEVTPLAADPFHPNDLPSPPPLSPPPFPSYPWLHYHAPSVRCFFPVKRHVQSYNSSHRSTLQSSSSSFSSRYPLPSCSLLSQPSQHPYRGRKISLTLPNSAATSMATPNRAPHRWFTSYAS